MSPGYLLWLSLVAIIWLQSLNGTNTNFPSYYPNSSSSSPFPKFNSVTLPSPLMPENSSVSCLGLPLLIYPFGVIVRNFPSDSQIPVGITTSYQGLSAKIYTDIVHAAAPHKPHKTAKAHLLLSSISPAIGCVIAAPLFAKNIDVVGRLRARSKKVGFFLLLLIIALLTGIYSVINSLGLTSRKLSPVAGAVVIAVFLLAPLLVPIIYLTGLNRLMKEEGEDDTETREVVPVGVMLHVESRGYSGTTDFVSWCSSFVFFGRLIPSLMDYYFFSRRKYMTISGPVSLVVYMPLIAGAFFFLLLDTKMALYVNTAIIGAYTRAITSVAVTITKELFGTNGISANYNLVIVNIPAGSFAYGYVASLLYRKEGKGDGTCMGMECYNTTFILWGSPSTVKSGAVALHSHACTISLSFLAVKKSSQAERRSGRDRVITLRRSSTLGHS
ncbi:hypothetical protein FH972_004878 [Carpinus fangiana]|uniref:Uncharacterized protein n=1 Tax=Carpinus fangiana TaxID=176857 RepID=A0A5N6QMI6_9ROSI|nr:hypothetical protein FH972_004878 [Carpinus fangiana]